MEQAGKVWALPALPAAYHSVSFLLIVAIAQSRSPARRHGGAFGNSAPQIFCAHKLRFFDIAVCFKRDKNKSSTPKCIHPPPNLMKSGYGHPRSKKSLEKCTTSKKQNNCDICRLQNYFFDENFRSKKNVVLMGVLHDCEGHRKWEAHVAGTTHLSFWPLWLIVPLSPVTNLISSPCVPCAKTYRPCK